ncbi:MAG: G8 domain-containing protein, partial [Variovorax sp.]
MSIENALRNLARWTAAATLVSLGSCGGSGSDRFAASADVLAVCSTAFDVPTGNLSKLATLFEGEPPAPVALSQCAVDASRNVTIGEGGCGPRVVIDRSLTGTEALGKITIKPDGKLAVPRVFDALELHTAGIAVEGLLSIGTAACPVGFANPASRIKVVFTGGRDSASLAGVPSDGSDKGIEVRAGGVLRLFGEKGAVPAAVSWTHLSRPAGPPEYQRSDRGIGAPVEPGGERRLHLARDIATDKGAWTAGDWIVVATSSFSPFESEFVQIESVTADGVGGSDITLVQPLRHYHFGGADPGLPSEANYGAGRETNFGVDERSEVGLISRSIVLTAQTPEPSTSPGDPDLHWGGEIRILPGFAEAAIQGVELEKFGKERL